MFISCLLVTQKPDEWFCFKELRNRHFCGRVICVINYIRIYCGCIQEVREYSQRPTTSSRYIVSLTLLVNSIDVSFSQIVRQYYVRFEAFSTKVSSFMCKLDRRMKFLFFFMVVVESTCQIFFSLPEYLFCQNRNIS